MHPSLRTELLTNNIARLPYSRGGQLEFYGYSGHIVYVGSILLRFVCYCATIMNTNKPNRNDVPEHGAFFRIVAPLRIPCLIYKKFNERGRTRLCDVRTQTIQPDSGCDKSGK